MGNAAVPTASSSRCHLAEETRMLTIPPIPAYDLPRKTGEAERSYIIEVDGDAAGVVFEHNGVYQFAAAHDEFASLEGQFFQHPSDAVRAARRVRQATGAGRKEKQQPELAK